MPANPDPLSKPRAEVVRPELTALPVLTPWRLWIRRFFTWVLRILVRMLLRVHAYGLENRQKKGPVLVVSNHLGDADVLEGVAYSSVSCEVIAKSELREFPILGWLMDLYGMIWIHRGQPDRRALRVILDGLGEGRMIGIAPEGRESVTGALEEGTNGAAYLALKAGVPLLPVTFTGTENARIYPKLKALRRAEISITIGPLFRLEEMPDRHQAIQQGTQKIMRTLADQLPPEYRGVYGTTPPDRSE